MRKFLLFLFSSCALVSNGQSLLELPIKPTEERAAISLLQDLEREFDVRFFYLDDWLKYTNVPASTTQTSLGDLLTTISRSADLSYKVMFGYAVIFTKDPANAIKRENDLSYAAASKKDITIITLGNKEKDFRPNKKLLITGTITAEQFNDKIPEVYVKVSDLDQFYVADATGRYTITLPAGEHVLVFQHQNYSDKVIDLRAYTSGELNIVMEEAPTVLQEVEVSDQAIVTGRSGQSAVSVKNLKRGPTFLGEADIIKNLQIQPGVTSVGEVSAGFNVRGGGTDQNLVLYDGVPIFNSSHALGFFSGFNPDAVGNVTFYRGGIPAEYGGRVSSVLNITSREGDYRRWTASGGVGIISSNVVVGGPLKIDTTSVLASFRSSYSNWLLRQVRSNYAAVGQSSLAFYDGSVKLTHRITGRTKMLLSGYTSHDDFRLSNDTLYRWQNRGLSLRFDHTHSDKLFSTATLVFGSYGYDVSDNDPAEAFKLKYGVTYPSVSFDFNYNGTHALAFGAQSRYFIFEPGSFKPTASQSSYDEMIIPTERSIESALYASDGYLLRENLFAEVGLRYSLYNRVGPGVEYHYESGRVELRNTTDSTIYEKGDVMKTYHGLEPRVSIRYTIDTKSSLKLGYHRVFQYVHLITNTAAITPIDIWQSSNAYFKPQIADQLSIGYYTIINDNMFECFIEGYYKNIQNILDFKDGAPLLLNKRIETALLRGKGIAYGVETSVSKVKGRLQGILNYTYSRSLRKVDGPVELEKINNGRFYASNADQPHVVNLNWRYGLSRRHFFSGNFSYHTGRPMSVPRDGYVIDHNTISDFSERNKYRMPDYHRLDLALIIEGNHKRKKILDGTWTVSFYNIYARKNAYSVFYKEDTRTSRLVPYRLSVIGTVIPSVSYGFKF